MEKLSGVCRALQKSQAVGAAKVVVVVFPEFHHCCEWDCPLEEVVILLRVPVDFFNFDVHKCWAACGMATSSLVDAAVLASPLLMEYHPMKKSYEV